MSIQGMAYTESQRDTQTPTKRDGHSEKSKSEALVDSIPGEILAPYTAILAIILANSDAGEWERGRWTLYIAGAVLVPTAVYILWRRGSAANVDRRIPLAGMVASTLAFGAWGLVMPGAPLTFSITDGGDLTIWTFIIVTVVTGLIAALPINRKV